MSRTSRKSSDPVAFMNANFNNTPPAALSALKTANKNSNGKAVWSETKMDVVSPYAARLAEMRAPLSMAKPTRGPADYVPPKTPPHVAATLRGFANGKAAMDGLMSMRAGLAAYRGSTDDEAKRYLDHFGLRPFAIGTTINPGGGGYLVADAIASAVLLRLATFAATRLLGTVIPVGTGLNNIPVVNDLPEVHYVQETHAIPDSDIPIGTLGVQVKKRAVKIEITNELLDDSAIATLDTFIRIVSTALAGVEDDELINGDSTSEFGGETGLLASLGAAGIHEAAAGHTSWSTLDVDDFAGVMSLLPERFSTQPSWLCSRPFFAAGMLANTGGVHGFDPVTGRPSFMGSPVVFCDRMPRSSAAGQVCCLFGDFASAIVFADRGIHFSQSDLAPGAFQGDYMILKAVSRYDLNVSNGGDATNPGAFVGLKTADT